MKILYADEKVKALCTDERKAQRRLGREGFKKLRRRLADLEAAQSLDELPAGRPHPLKGKRKGQFALDLNGGNRLVLEAADDPPPLDAGGNLEWRKVRSIRLILIGDYHDE